MWNSLLPLKKEKKKKQAKKIIEKNKSFFLTKAAIYVIYVRACVRVRALYVEKSFLKKIEKNVAICFVILYSIIYQVNKKTKKQTTKTF